jgi:hypothetical protein
VSGKYTPLDKHLKALPPEQRDVTMSFEQIERVLNDKLPPSAYKYQAWWANEKDGNHVHAHSWMNAGWMVDTVDRWQKRVRFRRE